MKRNQYIVCPVCGKNKMFLQDIEGNVMWVDYDPRNMEFIQVREGGGKTGTGQKGRGQGRGVGFPKIASMTLEDAVNAGGRELQIAKSIAKRVAMVASEFKRLGLIP